MAEVLIANAPDIAWSVVRQAVARIVSAVATTARVHDEWVLKFDIGQSVALITVQDAAQAAVAADVGRVHSWMIGVSGADYVRGSNGELPDIGGGDFEWLLTFAVWGFFDATLVREVSAGVFNSSQKVAEDEAELVAATMLKNPRLALDSPADAGVRQVRPLVFSSIDTHAFSDGCDAVVAQGAMQVRIERTL